MRKLALYYK